MQYVFRLALKGYTIVHRVKFFVMSGFVPESR